MGAERGGGTDQRPAAADHARRLVLECRLSSLHSWSQRGIFARVLDVALQSLSAHPLGTTMRYCIAHSTARAAAAAPLCKPCVPRRTVAWAALRKSQCAQHVTDRSAAAGLHARAASSTAAAAGSGGGSSDGPSICIIGAGVIGMTSALRIKQVWVRRIHNCIDNQAAGVTAAQCTATCCLCVQAVPAATVTVVAEQLEDTTSHCAGGLWKPYTLVCDSAWRSWQLQQRCNA